MKKENAGRLKRIIVALTITAALGLPVAAQDRSGYTLGSGRTDNASTTQSDDERSGVFMGSGTQADGTSTTQTADESMLTMIWGWMSNFI